MPRSFTLKHIRITVTLGKGVFSAGGNTRVIEGLACEVSVEKPGLPEKNSASIKIWGLSYEDMAQLTMLSFRPLESQKNFIEVMAGEQGGNLTTIFQGEISSAFADFNASPNPCMQFEADSGSYPQQIAMPVATVIGVAPAAALFARFADEAGYTYINQGVTASVKDIWLPGSPMDKMIKLARDIGCELIIDDATVLTLPAGLARGGVAVALNKDTGLIGYPTFTQDGISCRCVFNPNLVYGGLIAVESIVPRATGLWRITRLSHQISAWLPGGGSWESKVEAAYYE